jgi:cell wall-associated NlpC family hydrolase
MYEGSMQELSGVVADIRRRVAVADFSKLPGYGVDPGAGLAEVDRACSRLMDDVIRLEQATADLRRQLFLATQQQPGVLGAYGAALPDLWWFSAASGSAAPVVASTATPSAPPSLGAASAGSDGALRQSIVNTAQEWVGIPYLWGGGHGAVVSPRAVNVDCSGLVHEVFGENGLQVSGTAATMYASGTPVADLAHALPGDLLFWGTGHNIHHVAIYIGDGKMIEAPHTGAWVHVTNVYGGDFAGIRRLLP